MINKQNHDRKEGVHHKRRFIIFADYVDILASLDSQYKESLIYVSRFYSFLLLLLFIGMCVPAYLYAHKYSARSQNPEKGARFPGMIGSWKPPDMGIGNHLVPVEVQLVLLTVEIFFIPLESLFFLLFFCFHFFRLKNTYNL